MIYSLIGIRTTNNVNSHYCKEPILYFYVNFTANNPHHFNEMSGIDTVELLIECFL